MYKITHRHIVAILMRSSVLSFFTIKGNATRTTGDMMAIPNVPHNDPSEGPSPLL